MSVAEPPRPERGKTAQEAGSDASPAEVKVTEATSRRAQAWAMASPRFALQMADGYPAGVKQFLQFCLILVWPAFAFAALVFLVLGGIWDVVSRPLEWVLLLPFRVLHRRRDPEGYFEMYGRRSL